MQSEQELFWRVGDGDLRAREELARRWLGFARSLALRYRGSRAVDDDDLFQVASLALLKAIDGFDPGRGLAFSSYATPTIPGEIRRYFRDRTWAVRVPRGLQELSLRVDRAVRELAEQLQAQPSVAQIAAAVAISEEEVHEALQATSAYSAVSFDAPHKHDEDGGATLGERVAVVETGFAAVEQRVTLNALLAKISARERDVLQMRFEQDMTQAQIGEVIGVSQMQVSRIIRQTLQRLRYIAEPPPPQAASAATERVCDDR